MDKDDHLNLSIAIRLLASLNTGETKIVSQSKLDQEHELIGDLIHLLKQYRFILKGDAIITP